MIKLSYSEVAQLLTADFESGKLYWLPRTPDMFADTQERPAKNTCNSWNGRHAGKEALTADNGNGYRYGTILRGRFSAHRVLWLLAHKEWPSDQIDHINGIRHDNRLANLRCVTSAENRKNLSTSSKNKSGVLGVHWFRRHNKWMAQIQVAGRRKHLGYFADLADAAQARKAAEIKFGFHPNHGRR